MTHLIQSWWNNWKRLSWVLCDRRICLRVKGKYTWVYLSGLTHGVRPVGVESWISYLNPKHLSYSILNCSVVLLLTTFSGRTFHGITARCKKKFLRRSRLNHWKASYCAPFVEYHCQFLQKSYLLGLSPNRVLSCAFPAGLPSFAYLPTLSVYGGFQNCET